MMRTAVLGVSLVAVLCVSPPALAEPPAPPVSAAIVTPPPQAAAPDSPPPAATPTPPPPPQRKPWKEWLDRQAPLPSESAIATERVWYGWQTLLIDGVSLTAFALAAVEEEDFIWIGLGLLLIGSPIVHFAHLNVSSGVTSLAIRAASGGLVVLGAAIAVSDDFDGSDDSETIGTAVAIFGLLGVTTAVILDASYFGWEEKPKAGPRALLTPWIDPARGRYGLGYAASF